MAGTFVYWIDAQLPPALAPWLTATFGVEAYSAAYLGYREAEDEVIFQAARAAGAVVVSKDADFLERVVRLGPPPQLLYVTCGNTSKARLVEMFSRNFAEARRLLMSGEPVVEITS
jgi:predicted nuclease of predicted toxin-antitoxin system